MQASLVAELASTAAAVPLQISVAIPVFEAMTNSYCTWLNQLGQGAVRSNARWHWHATARRFAVRHASRVEHVLLR